MRSSKTSMRKLIIVGIVLVGFWGISHLLKRWLDLQFVLHWQGTTFEKSGQPEQRCRLFELGLRSSDAIKAFDACRADWLLKGYTAKPDSEYEFHIVL